MKFVPAVRYGSFLKMGIAAPPGAGKTFTALNIAKYLSEKGIALIDSEFRAARKYVGENGFQFEVLELLEPEEDEKGILIDVKKPFTPQRYMQAIKLAVDSGRFDVLIIDGISEEWVDAGGILQYVDSITRNGNTRDAWKLATPLHKDFINYILRAHIHIICTMQAKKEMVVEKDANGKAIGKKVTLEPVQREDIERPFDIFAHLQDKEMIITKSRCRPLDGQIINKPGKEVADMLRDWLQGDPMPERPEYEPDSLAASLSKDSPPASVTDQQLASLRKLYAWLGRFDPPGLVGLSFSEAKARIHTLSEEYKKWHLTTDVYAAFCRVRDRVAFLSIDGMRLLEDMDMDSVAALQDVEAVADEVTKLEKHPEQAPLLAS